MESSGVNPRSSISRIAFTICAMSSLRSLVGLSFCVSPRLRRKAGDDFAGIHQEHANVVLAQFLRASIRSCREARICWRNRRCRWARRERAVDAIFTMLPRCCLTKMLGGFARHQHRAGDVGGETALEARAVEIDEVLEHAEAGVVHQDVEIAEFLRAIRDRCARRRLLWRRRPESAARLNSLAALSSF